MNFDGSSSGSAGTRVTQPRPQHRSRRGNRTLGLQQLNTHHCCPLSETDGIPSAKSLTHGSSPMQPPQCARRRKQRSVAAGLNVAKRLLCALRRCDARIARDTERLINLGEANCKRARGLEAKPPGSKRQARHTQGAREPTAKQQ
jgi:hypothetical protein